VSKGAQQIFDCLPTERVAADDINEFVRQGRGDRHTVYVTVFKEQDLVRPADAGAGFDLQEYFDHPERYVGCFEPYLPSFTLLVNAVYWEKALSALRHLEGVGTPGRNRSDDETERHRRHHL
jgi:hypothetical protein